MYMAALLGMQLNVSLLISGTGIPGLSMHN